MKVRAEVLLLMFPVVIRPLLSDLRACFAYFVCRWVRTEVQVHTP